MTKNGFLLFIFPFLICATYGYKYNPILSEKVGIPSFHYRGPLAFNLDPENFGVWSDWVDCPIGGVLAGFQLKTYSNSTDKAGIVGMKLICKIPWEEEVKVLVFDSVPWGIWGKPVICNRGIAVGFQVKMEPHLNFSGDFKGFSDMAIYCTSIGGDLFLNKSRETNVETWGSWKEPKFCAITEAICRMRVANVLSSRDKSGFHRIEMGCCNDIDADYINVFLTRNQHKKVPGKILYMPILNSNIFSVGQNPEDYFLSFPHKQREFDFPYWHNWHFCKHPEFIVGYKFKLNQMTKQIQDIKFICQNPLNPGVWSSIGSGNDWEMTKEILCPTNTYAIGINVLFNTKKFIKNIRLICSAKGSNIPNKKYIEMDLNSKALFDFRWKGQQNSNFGRNILNHNPELEIRMVDSAKNMSEIEGWMEPEFCSPNQAICGFKLNAGAKNMGDNGPIDLRMNCCEIRDPAFYCVLQDKWDLVYLCDRCQTKSRVMCRYMKKAGFSRSSQYSSDKSLQTEFQNSTRVDNSRLYRESLGVGYSQSDDISFTESYNKLVSKTNSLSKGTTDERSNSVQFGNRAVESEDTSNTQTKTDSESSGSSSQKANTHSNSQQTHSSNNWSKSQSNTNEVAHNQHSSTHMGASLELSASATAGVNAFVASASVTVGAKFTGSVDTNWGQSVTNTMRNTEESSQGGSGGQASENSRSQTEAKTVENRLEKTASQMKSNSKGQQKENHNLLNRAETRGRRVDNTYSAEEKFGIDASHRVERRLSNNHDRGISEDVSRVDSWGMNSGRVQSLSWSQSSSDTWNEETSVEATVDLDERSSVRVYQLVGSCGTFRFRSVIIKFVDEDDCDQ